MKHTHRDDTERCVICGDETGRAGDGDDSIWGIAEADHSDVGPLCFRCYRRMQRRGYLIPDEEM